MGSERRKDQATLIGQEKKKRISLSLLGNAERKLVFWGLIEVEITGESVSNERELN